MSHITLAFATSDVERDGVRVRTVYIANPEIGPHVEGPTLVSAMHLAGIAMERLIRDNKVGHLAHLIEPVSSRGGER